jgi:hypothetical protein
MSNLVSFTHFLYLHLGHDALVLPPHGTEAGQNPSEAIAAIYRSIIGRDFMGGRKRFQTYKKIVMVLDPEQAEKIVNETSNYRPTQPPQPVTSPLPVGDNEETTETSSDAQDAEDTEDAEDAGQDEEEGVEADSHSPLSMHYSPRSDGSDMVDESGENDVNTNDEEEEELNSVREVTDEMILDESKRDDSDTEDDSRPSEDELEDQAMYGASGADDEEGSENHLVPEDEVSEEEALLDEQGLQEEVDLSEGVLAEDLNDIPAVIADSDEAGVVEDDSDNTDDETSGDDDDDNQGGGADEEDDKETEEAEEVPFVPLVETVLQVFERMLEQRSLLIVKNRARGIIEPEVPAANATNADATGTAAPAAITPLSA